MKIISTKVKFTNQVISEKTAKRNWWVGLFDDKHTAAKAKERAIAGTLKEETVKKMMAFFKMKMIREPQQALWEDMILTNFRVYTLKKEYGTIQAFTPELAIEQTAKREMGETETIIDIEGEVQFKWEALQCVLKAEEIK